MRTRLAFTTLAALLALAACKQQPPSNAMFDDGNNANDVPPPIELNQAYTAPEPAANVTNTLPPAAPPPEFSDNQQISDDADATGMTARLPSEETGNGKNETQPAEKQ